MAPFNNIGNDGVRLLGGGVILLVLGGSFLDQGLQLTGLKHLNHDVTATDQLTFNPQLGKGRPVGKFWHLGADIRILQDINVCKRLATGHQSLGGLGREATAG